MPSNSIVLLAYLDTNQLASMSLEESSVARSGQLAVVNTVSCSEAGCAASAFCSGESASSVSASSVSFFSVGLLSAFFFSFFFSVACDGASVLSPLSVEAFTFRLISIWSCFAYTVQMTFSFWSTLNVFLPSTLESSSFWTLSVCCPLSSVRSHESSAP